MGKVRGVRFTAKEEAMIEEFLKINSVMDFSTLAKVSILEFIKNPSIQLHAVGSKPKKEKTNVRSN